MSKNFFISLVLCLSLLGAASPALAQADEISGEDTLAKLQREGWKVINEGVLQRELKPGKVENFVFGVPGFTWQIQDLHRQLQKLQVEFRANPTPELRKAIASHRKVIANAQRILEVARTYEALGESGVPKESCVINPTADATATSKTDVQGVWAEASAAFSGDCDAEVYAYAFAKTWVNGAPATDTRTDGPRSGTEGSANALAESNGGAPCEAYAYSYVKITTMTEPVARSEYETFKCPSPLNVTVTSDAPSATVDLYNSDCITITWDANISGGTSPYSSTMYLNGVSQGAGPTYSGTWCNAGTDSSRTLNVSATITDSSDPARSKSGAAPTITVRSHPVTPPLNVAVTSNAPSTTIDLYNSDCITIAWATNISGGASPYTWTMYLNGDSVDTRKTRTYSKRYCNAGTNTSLTATVSATVTDDSSPAQSQSASAPTITIRSHIKPLAVTVTSNAPATIVDLYNSDCLTITWTTNISGGTSPYTSTMSLNSASQGTRTTYSKTYCNSGTNSSVTAAVSATVTDSGSPVQSKSATAPTVTIRSHPVASPPVVTVSMSPASSSASPLQLYEYDCVTVTWTASISGGTSPYTTTMYLNNVSLGQRTSYSRTVCNAQSTYLETITVRADVMDGAGKTATASKPAYIQHHYYREPICGGGLEPYRPCDDPR